ncbi:MAG: hypothetical protein KA035_02455 [Candidatus Levybacteria bacterium]|nr:hypothetical protein [Candidatus Levybacteria bacterium]
MREREPNLETQEAFWDGHSFKDSCPPTPRPQIPLMKDIAENVGCMLIVPSLVKTIVEIRRDVKKEKELQRELEEWLATASGAPAKTLGVGDRLELSHYPVGSIFRFSDTQQSTIKIGPNNDPRESTKWGVMTQRRLPDDSIVDFVQGFKDYEYFGLRTSGGIIEDTTVGEVAHRIYQEPFGKSSQFLQRYNWIEVWKFGNKIRETVPEKVGPLRTANPQRI